MKRPAASPVATAAAVADLVDLRDELAIAQHLAAAAYMACHALDYRSTERAALCAVTNATREKLEACLVRLDASLAEANQRQAKSNPPQPPTGRRQGA